MAEEADQKVRFKFNDKAQRHAFMMRAIEREDFEFKLDNMDSVVISTHKAERLHQLAEQFGGRLMPVREIPSHMKKHSRPQTHEERVASWNDLMASIDRELHRSPS